MTRPIRYAGSSIMNGYQKRKRDVCPMMSRQIIGEHISRRRAQRIMRKEGLLCTLRKPCPAAVAARRQAKANKKTKSRAQGHSGCTGPMTWCLPTSPILTTAAERELICPSILDCAGEVISYAVSESQDLFHDLRDCWMISGRTPSMKGPVFPFRSRGVCI